MNFADILIIIAIAIVVFLAIRKIIKNRTNGKNCCGECFNCPKNCENTKTNDKSL